MSAASKACQQLVKHVSSELWIKAVLRLYEGWIMALLKRQVERCCDEHGKACLRTCETHALKEAVPLADLC